MKTETTEGVPIGLIQYYNFCALHILFKHFVPNAKPRIVKTEKGFDKSHMTIMPRPGIQIFILKRNNPVTINETQAGWDTFWFCSDFVKTTNKMKYHNLLHNIW